MSENTSLFACLARLTPPVVVPEYKIVVSGQTAFMRDCPDCHFTTPHTLVDGGSECGVCGLVTLRKPAP